MKNPELKSCPFCGADGFAGRHTFPSAYAKFYKIKEFIVKCSNDDCLMFPSTGRILDLEKGIKAWNRRAK